ncbi:phage holin, partial [Escherichia coli]
NIGANPLTYLTNLYFKIKEDRRKAARGE